LSGNEHLTNGLTLLLRAEAALLTSTELLGRGRRSEVRHAEALVESGWDEIRLGIRRVGVVAQTGS
jgi:hypothetical protein